MSYPFYKVMHFFGIFMVLLALGGISLHIMNGGTREFQNRRWMAILHGIGLLLTLVGGFGLLARLGLVAGMPLWATIKLGVWFLLGILPIFLYRRMGPGKAYLVSIWILAAIAAWTAVYKPSYSTAEVAPAAAEVANDTNSEANSEANADAAPSGATEQHDNANSAAPAAAEGSEAPPPAQ